MLAVHCVYSVHDNQRSLQKVKGNECSSGDSKISTLASSGLLVVSLWWSSEGGMFLSVFCFRKAYEGKGEWCLILRWETCRV